VPNRYTPSSTRISRLIEGHQTRDALDRLEFLIEAGTLLSSSLDYETTLRNVARLCVPYLADWCIVYVSQPDGSIRRLAVEHADPARDDLAQEVRSSTSIDPTSMFGVPRVVRTGTAEYHPDANASMLAADVYDPAQLAPLLEPIGITSWLCVPLTVHGRTLGAISLVYAGESRRYQPSDLALAEEIGRRAAIAVENARLFLDAQDAIGSREEALRARDEMLGRETDMRAEVVSAADRVRRLYESERSARAVAERNADLIARLHTVIAALADAVTVDDVAARVLAEGMSALGARAGAIGLVEDDRANVRLVAAAGLPNDDEQRYARFPLDADLPMADAIRTRALVLLRDTQERAERYPNLGTPDTPNPSIAVVPALLEHEAVGALAFTFSTPRWFDLNEQEFLLALGKHTAQAFERAKLYESERRAREAVEHSGTLLSKLADLTAGLAATITSPSVVEQAVELCARAVDAAAAVLARVEGDECVLVHAVGFPDHMLDPFRRFPVTSELPLSIAVRTEAPVFIHTIAERDERFPTLADIQPERDSFAALPLVLEGNVFGALAFSFHGSRAFGDEERAFFSSVAQHCANALQRGELYTEQVAARVAAEASEYRLAFLAKASEALNSSLDTRATLATLADLIVPELADWCIIDMLTDDGRLEMVGISHIDPSKVELARESRLRYPPRLDLPQGLGEVLRSKRAKLYDEITEDQLRLAAYDEEHLALLREVGFTSLMIVPLVARGRTIGLMTFVSAESGVRFDMEMLRFADELAARAAIAVDNALLYREARENETRLGDIVGSVDSIVWEADARTGDVLFINGRAAELAGFAVEEWTNAMSWAQMIHPEDRDEMLTRRREAVRRGESHELEYRIVTADARVRWFRDRVRVTGDAGARRLYGVTLDVTAEKLGELRRATAYAVTDAFATAETLNDATTRLVDAVCTTLGWDVGEVWLLDDEGMLRSVDLRYRPEYAAVALASRELVMRPGDPGFPGEVVAAREARWFTGDELQSYRRSGLLKRAGLLTAVSVPVLGDTDALGALQFMSSETRTPDPDLVELLTTVGRQLGQFVERSRVEAEVRAQRALLDALSETTIDGTLVVAPDGSIRSFNRRFAELWDLPQDVLDARTHEAAIGHVKAQVTDPEGFVARIAQLMANPEEVARDEIALADGRVFDRWSSPVRDGSGAYYGRAWYFRDVTEQKTTERELLAAGARARFLAMAAEMLSASLDTTEMLQGLADLCVPYLADACTIELIEQSPEIALRRVAGAYSDAELAEYASSPLARGWDTASVTFDVMQSGRPVIVPRIPDKVIARTAGGRPSRAQHPRATIVAPLIAGPAAVGAITFHRVRPGASYGGTELALAEDLGRRTALAVDNARLYADRSHVARTLQESLLPPSLPLIPRAAVAARYRAAGSGHEVGGDFYDVFETGDEWVLVIGDVCGKGAEAAAATALARYTLRASAMQARRPSRVLSMLNDAMLLQLAESRFCTVAYARLRALDDGGFRLTLACGGHPLPILLRADGTVREIGSAGTVMGAFPEPVLVDRSVRLAPGDTVVFFTDGVLDARGEDGLFGEERLAELIANSAGLDADALAGSIETTVARYSGDSPRDDVAVLVLQIGPDSQ
jgi:PAS domain S-box-containing protein